ncbi:MAG: ribbon-helix-helix domain-containing protein [Armatimonadetes bacterium]|nr:ribbon-helix-helix domain-containing protein [Armatimonadota bacterium]
MKRTQIYLSNNEWQLLRILSQEKKVPVAQLVREAVDKVYAGKSAESFRDALGAVAGIWKKRRDLGRTCDYLRKLREDGRLEGFHGDE